MTRARNRKRLILLVASGLALLAGAIAAWDAVSAWRVDKAVRRLKSADPAVRKAAIDHLAALRRGSDLRRLAWYLGDENDSVRNGVVEALGRIGAPAVEYCVAFARNNVRVPFYWRFSAYRKLCRWVPALRTPTGQLRLLIAKTPTASSNTASLAPARAVRANESLLALFPKIAAPAVRALISMAEDDDPNTRRLAVTYLAQMSDPDGNLVVETAALGAVAGSERSDAVTFLATAPDDDKCAVLLRAYETANPRRRHGIVLALEEIRDRSKIGNPARDAVLSADARKALARIESSDTAVEPRGTAK